MPDGPPGITPSAGVRPAFAVPGVRERMIQLARQEWALFGRPVVNYATAPPTLSYPPDARLAGDGDGDGGAAEGDGKPVEIRPPFLARVILYWYSVSKLPIVGYEGELRPWSAAFIAWLARGAGVPRAELPSTVLHWDYIEHILAAGEGGRFVARDARRYAPKPGDLICAPRGEGFVDVVSSFQRLRRGAYHCNIVVAARPGELDVIGGNVLDSVSLTHAALDAEGRVLPTADRPWVVVIEQRDVD
ncbi:hypothetical protein MoryE10_23120 [Methylogaea oryzae]|uniref:DUF2272 domain-containing protein n=1 Tax=Methylogaea oryzae TaxID=1295382 RepID=A0A8D4VQ48_9GAMM|nr:hypothetical protein MoryE10_23120 [Methylogaea oryzae]